MVSVHQAWILQLLYRGGLTTIYQKFLSNTQNRFFNRNVCVAGVAMETLNVRSVLTGQ